MNALSRMDGSSASSSAAVVACNPLNTSTFPFTSRRRSCLSIDGSGILYARKSSGLRRLLLTCVPVLEADKSGHTEGVRKYTSSVSDKTRVIEQVICLLPRFPEVSPTGHDNASIREGLLLTDLIVTPSGRVQFRKDVLSAGGG